MNDNTALIASLNHYLALGTLIGFVLLVIWVIDLVLMKFGFMKGKRRVYEAFTRYALPLGFLVTLFATLTSLYYSYYLHIPACDLCWFQRAFIYPLMFLFGFAWCKNDTKVFDYIMGLSVFGFAIALYHHYLQLGYDLLKPCSTAPFAVDCATPTFIQYGFITYPFMAVVVLGFTFLLAFTAKRLQK